MPGYLEIQGSADIHDTQGPAGMTGGGRTERDQVEAAHIVGSFFQFRDGIIAELGLLFCYSNRHVDLSPIPTALLSIA